MELRKGAAMHELIAFLICIPLLLSFVPQYSLQMKNNRNMDRVDTIVNSAKEEARQAGYFTDENITHMVDEIVELGFTEDEVIVNVTKVPKYRTETFDSRELIEYEVGVPIEKKIAANQLFGISDEENKGTYYTRGAVTSEKLPYVESD
ncbi:hypothetical protein [Anaerovorax sp. IOR16]|uniref:hypothetical protein n=1 Tax=Anaerovorax sp. IOR16 TaxID=2773458 RepID=UPI0019D0DA15|nr:hypothetical protein [Anaerovorax sp. IOR16]